VGSGWVFGSNLSSCVALGARGEIDHQSLTTYLQLSYIPAPASILKGVQKCLPGNAILINVAGLSEKVYYALPDNWVDGQTDATEPAKQVKTILENSVKRRLIADVPVGTFLSGGLDSSVISLLAAREHPGISAFSIGFPDQPFYDESAYARITAKQIGVNHHVLEVREKDLEEELYHILDTFDEPFADSSAILVNMLSKFTRKEVTVALSGDGADELFGGYNKHRALYRSTGKGLVNAAMKKSNRILELLPASRSHKTFDKLRKAQRYSRGLKLDFPERYWAWACFSSQKAVYQLLRHDKQNFTRTSHIEDLLQGLNEGDFNSVLKADFQLVLANDMLYKVDSMSMQHGLEVRVPFLDHHLVDYVFKLHSNHKIDKTVGKKLLRSAFDKDFPSGAFDRNKRGFEAPLKQWFAKALRPMLDQYCNASFLEEQGLFNPTAVAALRQKVSSNNPGDAPHTLWAILVFQHWWNRHRVGRLQS
jgi:asparagine synthase (glutamine-hydrolysing)